MRLMKTGLVTIFISHLAQTLLGLGIAFSKEPQRIVTQDCSQDWVLFSSKPKEEGAYPDTNVTYYRYVYAVPANEEITIELKGTFPKGRYMGFNLYDTANFNSEAGIADFEILADEGSVNPWRESGQGNRDYTVKVQPKTQATQANTLPYPSESIEFERTYEVWYRIYLPEGDAQGEVALPKIFAKNAKTGAAVACPQKVDLPVSKIPRGGLFPKKLLPLQAGETIYFYHHKGAGLYANKDTHYLATRLPYLWDNPKNYVEFRFKAPTTPLTTKAPRSPEVRYWSFCAGAGVKTITYGCVSDKEVTINPDGFITLNLGPESLRSSFSKTNFLAVPEVGNMVLIYRNLLPAEGFPGNFEKIPTWPPDKSLENPIVALQANQFISDFSPVGTLKEK